ncbi:MAG: DUF4114 domain-containing protein [Cyanobacteria bacterium J055]|nr:MAG: DUF4114 domain-containing protein [Cyanobacteria bacterium J055]
MVPNRTFQETLDTSATNRSRRLLFSVSDLNPGKHTQFVQVSEGGADGNLFAFEDLRLDRNSDKSFNDIVLQMRGIEGQTPLLSDVIDPKQGFWSKDMGQALIDYGNPYLSPAPINSPLDEPLDDNEIEDLPSDDAELNTPITRDDDTAEAGLETTIIREDEVVSDNSSDTEEDEIVVDAPTDTTSEESEVVEDTTTLPTEEESPADNETVEALPEVAEVPSISSSPPERFDFPQAKQPLVGILDTGLAANNPDIDYGNITSGTDRVDGDADPLLQPGEGSQHGTHVVGIIAAQQDNGIGIDGINPDAPIVIERAIGSGEWTESLIALVDRIRESEQPNGIINLSQDLIQTNPDGSIATRYELTPKERAAIEYARQNNVLLVVAAGNDNGVMSALGQAGQEFDNIATVGAAKRLDVDPSIRASEAFIRADYSSYGYGLDLVAEGGTTDNPIFSTVGTGIGTMAGSSIAAAHVTGGASLVWAANPGLNYRQVLQILKDTSTDLSTTNWDAETGSGLLNIDAAVKLAKVTAPEEYTPPMSFIPDTWSGEDIFIPGERAVETYLGSFSGQVTATIGANLRSGPSTDYTIVETVDYNQQFDYDAWTVGEFISYPGLGEDDRWYRIAETDLWISAAITTGEPPTISPEPTPDPTLEPTPDPAYYPDLASLSDAQWNDYTGDNTRFDYGWPDFRDERHLTPEPMRDIYTDLSNAVLGKRGLVTAGYLLDPGYRQGIGKWHSGIDLDADPGDAVKVAVGGNVVTIQGISGDYFMGVQGDDGKLWIYGHLGTVAVPSGRIETGQTIGTIGFRSHLHLEVQPGPSYSPSQSADQNVVGNATLNPVKSFWELQNQNSFAPIDPETPGGSQPAIPGEQAEYIIKPGDTLSAIAQRYLGDANRWPEIMKSPNGETFTSEEAKLLQIGQSVYLPVTYETGDGNPVSNPPANGSTDGMRAYEFGHLGSLDDTLWEIAERELGSGFRWTEIRKADGTTYTSAEAAQISRGTIVYLPDGNSSDGNTNPPDDGSQDSGNEAPINDEQPGDEHGNDPETVLIDIEPLSEVPLLIGQRSNPGWGTGSDFVSGDREPYLSSLFGHWGFEADFWAGILPIPGDLATQMADRFLAGSGDLWEHSHGSELSQLVESDDDFIQMFDDIALTFQQKLQSQIDFTNSINLNDVNFNLDLYSINFEFPGIFGNDDRKILWGTLGGTQGTELYLNQFNAEITSVNSSNVMNYSTNLDFVIYDDFGAGDGDNVELTENPLKFPLRAMWHLQHRGRIAQPFVNKVVVNGEISGQVII